MIAALQALSQRCFFLIWLKKTNGTHLQDVCHRTLFTAITDLSLATSQLSTEDGFVQIPTWVCILCIWNFRSWILKSIQERMPCVALALLLEQLCALKQLHISVSPLKVFTGLPMVNTQQQLEELDKFFLIHRHRREGQPFSTTASCLFYFLMPAILSLGAAIMVSCLKHLRIKTKRISEPSASIHIYSVFYYAS